MSKHAKNKTFVIIALVSSLLSIVIHLHLAFNHFKQKLGLADEKSLCNINDRFNCDIVSMSPYASFLQQPMALWGGVTHFVFCLFLVLWFTGLLSQPNRVLRFSTWLSLFIALTSIVMGTISLLTLHTYCVFCIATYLLSFLMAGAMLTVTKSSFLNEAGKDFVSLFGEQKWNLITLCLIPFLTYFLNQVIQESLTGTGAKTLHLVSQDALELWQNNPHKNFTDKGLILQSDSKVPYRVTVVEFADYLCPHCKVLSGPLHNLVLANPHVRLIYKPFPLDGACNESGMNKHDGLRCELVYATFCGENLFQKGWAVHEYIFAHQAKWNASTFDSDIEQMAQSLAFDSNTLRTCMKSSDIHQSVLDMVQEGKDILGTPSIFVNGQELPKAVFLPILEAAISRF